MCSIKNKPVRFKQSQWYSNIKIYRNHYNEVASSLQRYVPCLTTLLLPVIIYRYFGFFTMESILAVAFGRDVELHPSDGHDDPLTKAARSLIDLQRPTAETPNIYTIVALKCKTYMYALYCTHYRYRYM